jgi:hypothetical protein
MIQFQDNPWQQVCPLPPASEPPADRGILAGEEGSMALPPLAAERHSSPQPPALLEDEYQWMVLL